MPPSGASGKPPSGNTLVGAGVSTGSAGLADCAIGVGPGGCARAGPAAATPTRTAVARPKKALAHRAPVLFRMGLLLRGRRLLPASGGRARTATTVTVIHH